MLLQDQLLAKMVSRGTVLGSEVREGGWAVGLVGLTGCQEVARSGSFAGGFGKILLYQHINLPKPAGSD